MKIVVSLIFGILFATCFSGYFFLINYLSYQKALIGEPKNVELLKDYMDNTCLLFAMTIFFCLATILSTMEYAAVRIKEL